MKGSERQGTLQRKTKETTISVSLNLDGSGKRDIHTGVGFFDHMLAQFAEHSCIDVSVNVQQGDTHIDDHHTVEDVGIVMGIALLKALGTCEGIVRYASSLLPMDDALISCALDCSGRSYIFWDVAFTAEKVGTFDVELVQEFFRALIANSGITAHLSKVRGSNSHHIAEATFKAFAVALRHCIEIDSVKFGRVPSTKGILGWEK